MTAIRNCLNHRIKKQRNFDAKSTTFEWDIGVEGGAMYQYVQVGLGQVGSPDTMNGVGNQVQSLSAPGWQPFTPVFTTSGTQPTIGNGVYVGRYRRASGSDLIIAEAKFTFGSTTAVGTGSIYLSLPVPASAGALAFPSMGAARILDASSQFWSAVAYLDTATRVAFIGNSGGVSNSWTAWAVNDAFAYSNQYEPA